MSPLELLVKLLTMISIFLAGRNNLHTWWLGILGSALFVILFFRARLYACRGLYLTALLYAANWVNACYSAFVWRRLMRAQAGEAMREVPA